ncbi:hypothetical protein EOD42_15865 [Rhodovarius crocodyli]|uniref:DUF3467 domain-containing protein n=1 Tax=Rhodovarius crocodyli TaxID=1979269 RepID=A0A437MDM3_9PROT|nr:hypothetical protein [Rhodovarius crocodyli]RVT95673.1 hypothetical protein EOD42_15865 [Rhodovarius crocodyli]
MSLTDKPAVFADGIMDASVHYGVARITLAQLGPDGKAQPSGQLMVPLVQLPAMANALAALVRQIEAKLKETPATAAAPAQPAAAPGEATPMPGAFTFGSR